VNNGALLRVVRRHIHALLKLSGFLEGRSLVISTATSRSFCRGQNAA
jgi:hypothetical protein